MPKKIAGEYSFDRFENFAHWITTNTRTGKNVGPLCHNLAKQGICGETKIGWNFEATTDTTFEYNTLQDLGERTAVLKAMNIYNRDPEIGLIFARAVDALR